jgi:hypothetical protein
MTQNGPITMDVPGANGASAGPIALTTPYTMCRICLKRFKAAPGDSSIEELRCECGAGLHGYEAPVELSTPARGVLPRLIRFWLAGREDGYWGEKRFFRPAAAERAGVAPRQVRFAYEAGRRVGERLRDGAHLHAMRVMKMKATASAATGTARLHAAA